MDDSRSQAQLARPVAIPTPKGQALRSISRTRTSDTVSDAHCDIDSNRRARMDASRDSLDECGYPQSVSMSQMSIPKDNYLLQARVPPTDTESYNSDETSTSVSPKSHPKSNFVASRMNPSPRSGTSNIYGTSEREVDGAGSETNPTALSPTTAFIDSPPSLTRPASSADSDASVGSVFEWNHSDILALSDRVRAAVQRNGIESIDADDVEKLNAMMNRFWHDELAGKGVDFSVIVGGRIDKMLEGLFDRSKPRFGGPLIRSSIGKAFDLRAKWELRFGAKYAAADVTRLAALKQKWFGNKSIRFLDVESDIGSWWPSLECVFHHGIIKTLDEVAAHGQYGPFWMLPMLTGKEVDGPKESLYIFKKEGSEREMHTRLMTTGGKKIRVLRGHTLDSKYAPRAGIRYDGEYTLQSYSRVPSQDPNGQKLVLVLRRVDGQMSVDDLQKIPKPSQLDDFQMYNRLARSIAE